MKQEAPHILNAFIERCDGLASAMNIKRSTLSLRVFFDGKALDQIANGTRDVGVRRLAAAEREVARLEGEAFERGGRCSMRS